MSPKIAAKIVIEGVAEYSATGNSENDALQNLYTLYGFNEMEKRRLGNLATFSTVAQPSDENTIAAEAVTVLNVTKNKKPKKPALVNYCLNCSESSNEVTALNPYCENCQVNFGLFSPHIL